MTAGNSAPHIYKDRQEYKYIHTHTHTHTHTHWDNQLCNAKSQVLSTDTEYRSRTKNRKAFASISQWESEES